VLQDPDECRRQAAECLRLAQKAKTFRARLDLSALAHTWLQFAVMLETGDKSLPRGGENVVPFKPRRTAS
jgi:hypothetical protein